MIFGTSHREHWNSRQFLSCLFFGILDFVHELAQKGIEDIGIPYFFSYRLLVSGILDLFSLFAHNIEDRHWNSRHFFIFFMLFLEVHTFSGSMI